MATRVSQKTQFIIEGTVRHFLAGFVVDRRSRGLAKGTITYYLTELNLFCEFLDAQGVVNLAEVTADEIRKYLLQLEGGRDPSGKAPSGRKPGGVHAAFRAVRAFFNWYEEEFEPDDWKNPIKKVKGPKVSKNPLEGVSAETIKALIARCTTEQGRRDRLILMMLFDTGMRASELLALDLEDLDLITGAVQVRKGKGGKARTVFLGNRSRKELRAYLKERGLAGRALFVTKDGDRLRYQGLVKIISRRAKDAGLLAPGLHDFRRAFALTMLRNGCDLARLAELMGHASLEVLRRYLHLVVDDLREAHHQAGPVDKL